MSQTLKTYDISAAILQHGSRLLPMTGNFLSGTNSKPWKSYTPKQHGAARLFNYMEASDGSDAECEQNTTQDRITNSGTRNQLDFFEAGDAGLQNNGEHDDVEEDTELPLFICRECGCEFIDDISLDTHMLVHHHVEKIPASPKNKNTNKKQGDLKKTVPKSVIAANKTESKENMKPKSDYICVVCKINFSNQINIMNHMKLHINLTSKNNETSGKKHCSKKSSEFYDESNVTCYQSVCGTLKRSRKQSQPRKVVPPFYESQEIQVLKGTSLKHRQWKYENESTCVLARLREKYMNKLINRKGYYCNLCKKSNSFFPYHTKTSLVNHYMFKHMGVRKHKCEHCPMKFRHKYQVVLHASRKHVFKSSHENTGNPEIDKQAVPKMNNKQALMCSVPSSNGIENDTLVNTNVPDNSTCVDKMNISSYLDQPPMINNNGSQQMPITIPTFPPT